MINRTTSTAFAITIALSLTYALNAGGQTLDWIRQEGTQSGFDLYDVPGGVAADGLGSVYVVGSFEEGIPPVQAAVAEEAFITKYDDAGEIQWTQTLGVPGFQDGFRGVATDLFGNAIVAGNTRSDLVGQNQGYADLLLTKYNSNGTLMWSKQIGSESADFTEDIAVDGLGNIYVTGSTGGEDVGLGGPVNRFDAYVSKFDEAGNLQWVRQFGGFGSDAGHGIAVDNTGNIYMAGQDETESDDDGFLRKYDTNGALIWDRVIATSEFDRATGVAVDEIGNVFVSGFTRGDLESSNQGELDWFLRSYDTDGTLRWTRQMGSEATEGSFDVVADEHGRVYVVGGSQGDLRGTNAGERDPVVIAFDQTGTELWSWQGGTDAGDGFRSVASDGLGHLYAFGQTGGVLGDLSFGGTDVFLAKFTLDLPQPGDTDGDGDVDVDDLNAVRNHFGATGADDGSLAGDARPFDGIVDINDLNAVRNHFGSGTTPVPEPASVYFVLMGAFFLAAGCYRNKRRRCLAS